MIETYASEPTLQPRALVEEPNVNNGNVPPDEQSALLKSILAIGEFTCKFDEAEECLSSNDKARYDEAFTGIYVESTDIVDQTLRRFSGSIPYDAEGVHLDAVIKVANAATAGKFNNSRPEIERAFVRRVIRNTLLDKIRAQRSRPSRPIPETPDHVLETADKTADAAYSAVEISPAESHMISIIDIAQQNPTAAIAYLEQHTASVPNTHLVAIILKAANYKYSEIAQLLDVPIGTVRSRINNGRETISEQLESGELSIDPILTDGTDPVLRQAIDYWRDMDANDLADALISNKTAVNLLNCYGVGRSVSNGNSSLSSYTPSDQGKGVFDSNGVYNKGATDKVASSRKRLQLALEGSIDEVSVGLRVINDAELFTIFAGSGHLTTDDTETMHARKIAEDSYAAASLLGIDQSTYKKRVQTLVKKINSIVEDTDPLKPNRVSETLFDPTMVDHIDKLGVFGGLERSVLKEELTGLSSADIADKLNINVAKVYRYRSNIRKKVAELLTQPPTTQDLVDQTLRSKHKLEGVLSHRGEGLIDITDKMKETALLTQHGFDYQEASDILGVSVTAVSQRMTSLKNRIHGFIEDHPKEAQQVCSSCTCEKCIVDSSNADHMWVESDHIPQWRTDLMQLLTMSVGDRLLRDLPQHEIINITQSVRSKSKQRQLQPA